MRNAPDLLARMPVAGNHHNGSSHKRSAQAQQALKSTGNGTTLSPLRPKSPEQDSYGKYRSQEES
ncbi:hypothetical protein [Prochlorococcus marinus]|uniref:hypothetical protein n=1 Tax=Prochlorococcus marinus TaxID=1219 RepID=UPI00030BD64C|nr:hypothetical protein [Prochlorococcus marinus]